MDYHLFGKNRRQWVFEDYHGCPAEQAALKQMAVRQAETQLAAEADEKRRLLNTAGLVGWLGRATFASFDIREDWPKSGECLIRARDYFISFSKGSLPSHKNWLIMYGTFGSGKSHLGAAIIREAVEVGLRQCYFRVWPDYLQRIKATWPEGYEGQTEDEIIAELKDGRLVVIDDLDKNEPSEWVKTRLYEVLNARYNAELPTVLTFNYGPDDLAANRKTRKPGQDDPQEHGRLALEAYLGKAVLDRVIGAAYDVIEFNGPSYRSGVIL